MHATQSLSPTGDTPSASIRFVSHEGISRAQWQSLVMQSRNLYALYQSPEWFDHVLHTGREELLSPVVLMRDGSLEALALPYRKAHPLVFEIRQYPLARLPLRTISFLGCEPLFPPEESVHDALFGAILAADPRCDGIYLHSIPTGTFLWRYLHSSKWVGEQLLVHLPEGVRRFHALELPDSFQHYEQAQFDKKKRYNLKRQARVLREHAGGELALRRCESVADAKAFVAAATHVSSRSWQIRHMIQNTFGSLAQPSWLEDLAQRGVLRSYVLLCGRTPCAIVLGYQIGEIYHYSETSYDESFARFSPGSVLLYLMIEDLIQHRPPRWVNFGVGDSRYKEEFANVHWDDASVLLLRKGMRNTLARSSHAGFRRTVRWIKEWTPGWSALPALQELQTIQEWGI